MKSLSLRFPSRFVKNRLLFKLVLAYAFIMIVPLLVAIYLIAEHVNAKIVELEVAKQDELTNKMSAYVEEQYNKIRNVVYWLYSPDDGTPSVSDLLKEPDQTDSAYSDYYLKNKISSDLDKIVLWDKELLDIVVVSGGKEIFSTSKRSLAIDYDFLRNPAIAGLAPSEKKMQVTPNPRLDYILDDNVPVVSHTGNLFDFDHLQDAQAIGQYVINLSVPEMMKSYRQFAGDLQASFYLYDDDGNILLSNDPDRAGQAYPYLRQVSELSGHEITLGSRSFILNQADLSEYGLHIVVQTPKSEITRETNLLIRQILATFFSGILVVLVLTLLFSSNIASKIKKLLTAMRQVEKGQFDAYVAPGAQDELGQLTNAFNRMCARLKDHVDMVYMAEIRTKSAELSALQARIDPHFLLNTIESIRMSALKQAPEVSDMLYILGKLFHWKVRSNELIIDVEEELAYSTSFLYLLQVRFGEQLAYKIEIEEALYELGIPKLLLQPIIENASQHGLFRKNQRAMLLIRGYRDGHKAVFDIVDNGVGMDDEQLRRVRSRIARSEDTSAGEYQIGLSNVQQRIRLLFGDPYGMDIASKKDYWTRVRVTIPAMPKERMTAIVPDFYR